MFEVVGGNQILQFVPDVIVVSSPTVGLTLQ